MLRNIVSEIFCRLASALNLPIMEKYSIWNISYRNAMFIWFHPQGSRKPFWRADYFNCGEGVDEVKDYNPAQGDIIESNCEIVFSSH
jgi:hypothetical protein